MSLFKKPKKNIVQRRVFTENDDEEDERMDFQESRAPDRKTGKKEKAKKPKQTLLSFETEEEGEVFQVKKSSHNKKVMRMFEKEKKKKDKEKTEKEEPKSKEERTEVVTDDLVLVVTQNYKKPPTPPPPILTGRDALCAGKDDLSSEEDDASIGSHRFSKPDNVKKVLESGAIPDAAMIHAARKKRQKAREMGDFIPTEEEEPEDTGRLVRDDDNEESDEDRIDMDVNLTKRDQDRRREQFLAAQDPESDHELDEWEDQQIRKGVTGAAMTAAQEIMMDYQVQQTQQTKATVIPIIEPGIIRTPQMIAAKLKEHYSSICQSRDENLAKLRQIQEDIDQANEEIEELKIKAPEAAEKFRFYQELRGYITDLVECLDEKVGTISNLEQRAGDLMAAMSKFIVERRRQDVRDQAEEATGKGALKKEPEDEEKVRRAAEREGRRSRRRRAREMTATPGGAKHVEGMSSDEEMSQQDLLFFDKEKQEVEQELQDIFEDVVDDYSSLVNILIRFEHWRSKDPAAYHEAYASLCLPKVVSPMIRFNLIFWNPLTESKELEKLEWYRTLALYGLHDDETESTLAKDPDINLLPSIVEKILVPKVTNLVDSYWDPLSSSQTLRLVGCVGRFIRKYPTLGPESMLLANLFNAIFHKMKASLDNDVFIPVTPKIADSKNQFFQRQFASGLKLLKNITSWQGIINETKLKELALNSLLNRYLLSALKFCSLTDAAMKVRLISQVLPRVWLQESPPEFKMFTMAIANLQQQLDKNNPLHLESIDILSGIMKTLRSTSYK
ncbi:PAX3- and PAX7-binding protein 1 [Euwallacea fornicatus]|uniref:PAX3- and PAX7-binding protein 1 n=1 Tax=Euwallacea fornicatus TaxID=995702 RepID=UPI00338DAA23